MGINMAMQTYETAGGNTEMKKRTFSILLLMSSCLFAGCGNQTLDLDKIQTNTIMIEKDGAISSATVEEFEKSYYSEEGLKVFVEQEIGAYNKKNREDSVILDSMQVKDGTASLLISYENIEQYAQINRVEAGNFTMEEAKQNIAIPTEFTDASANENVSWEEISSDSKYKVAVVNEPMDIIVTGKVKYYSGGVLLNESTVQSDGTQTCVVVYKP